VFFNNTLVFVIFSTKNKDTISFSIFASHMAKYE
jgi:hypothetical protein